jgi:hypothetical protein
VLEECSSGECPVVLYIGVYELDCRALPAFVQ